MKLSWFETTRPQQVSDRINKKSIIQGFTAISRSVILHDLVVLRTQTLIKYVQT